MYRGIRSSRKLEEACNYRFDFIWLVEGRRIDHTTFSKFRTKFHEPLKSLFRQIGRTAMVMGLIQLGVVAFDGTRVKANDSRYKTRTAKTLEEKLGALDELFEQLTAELNTTDTEQAAEGSPTKLPEPLADLQQRRERIHEALERANEKRVDCGWEIQNVWAPENPVSDYNPLGKVPVLVLDDGTALYDSRGICEFLDSVSPIGKLIPADNRERIEVRRWETLADGVLDSAVLARLEGLRPAGERSQSWIDRQMDKVGRGLDAMDIQIGARQWCCGNGFTLADIAVGACVGWLDFRFRQLEWRRDRANLARLAVKLADRPSFAETVPRE